jgi:HlyD family secretion protein
VKNARGKKIIVAIIFLAAISAVASIGIKNYSDQPQDVVASSGQVVPKDAIVVTTDVAREDEIITLVNARGTAELIDKTTLYARTQGRISDVRPEVGSVVNEGDIVVVYDDKQLTTLLNQLENAQLSLKAAQVALEISNPPPTNGEISAAENNITQAEKAARDAQSQIDQADLQINQLKADISVRMDDYRTVEQLYTQGVSPKRELENAYETLRQLKNQFDTATSQRQIYAAALEAAKGNVEYAKKQYEITKNRQNEPANTGVIQQRRVQVEQAELSVRQIQKEIDDFIAMETAPSYGTVLTLNAQAGGTVATGTPLMEIGDVSGTNIVIKVNVPENRAVGVEIGEPVEIRGDALGSSVYEGVVTKIHPKAEPKQIGNAIETVITVEVTPLDASAPIKPGYTIEADIITRVNANAVIVPIMSLMTENGASVLYVVNGDFTVEKRVVELGSISGMDVEVLSGVSLGEQIVVTPPDTLADGVYVNPYGPEKNDTAPTTLLEDIKSELSS